MMYEEVIRDFAQRTQKNLQAIEYLLKERKEGRDVPEVFETTQLVNSTLGLLVFPQQQFVDDIPETPINELKEMGWPVPKVCSGFPQVEDLNQLIRYLRNAIAHFNIRFIGDGQNQISFIKVWNCRDNKKTWEAELSVSDLQSITEKFIELLLSK
jgi:hypothetical protein